MTRDEAYTLLGLTTAATADEVKKSYRKKAMQYHPDRNKDAPEVAEAKFKKIKEAYELINSKKQGESENSDFDSIFKNGFKKGSYYKSGDFNENPFRNAGFKGFEGFEEIIPPLPVTVKLTLEQAFLGDTHKVPVNVVEYCKILSRPGLSPKGPMLYNAVTNQGNDRKLHVTFEILPHEVFELDKNNLHVTVNLDLLSFYTGGTFKIKTLEDKELTVKIPKGAKPDSTCKLKGQGYNLPNLPRGDIIVHFGIDLPELTETQIKQLQEILN